MCIMCVVCRMTSTEEISSMNNINQSGGWGKDDKQLDFDEWTVGNTLSVSIIDRRLGVRVNGNLNDCFKFCFIGAKPARFKRDSD